MNKVALFTLIIIPFQLIAHTNSSGFHNSGNISTPFIADDTVPNTKQKRLIVFVDAQELITTHSTFFAGTSFTLNYPVSDVCSLGLGIEYSHSNFHDDNGWNITKLNFIPVYIDTKVNLANRGKFTPHAQLSTGITFKNYQKVWSDHPSPSYANRYKVPPTGVYNISEVGWYLYSGIGASFKVNKKLSTYFDIGIKAFHMSWNPWEINPRGLTMKLGIML